MSGRATFAYASEERWAKVVQRARANWCVVFGHFPPRKVAWNKFYTNGRVAKRDARVHTNPRLQPR